MFHVKHINQTVAVSRETSIASVGEARREPRTSDRARAHRETIASASKHGFGSYLMRSSRASLAASFRHWLTMMLRV